MPAFLRTTGRVLACFLALDLVGIGLTLLADLIAGLHHVWEGSSFLAYAIWFVVGVFCAMLIYFGSNDDHDSPEGRRRGTRLLIVTGAVALVLGLLSSLVWSDTGAGEAVAPDHRGVTITYLLTVVLGVAWTRFVLFGETVRSATGASEPPSPRKPFRPIAKRLGSGTRAEQDRTEEGAFKPAGFWGTVGFLVGVPVLLFLDASFFLLGPFDYFDRWTDPILTTSVAGGLALGFAASRWQGPRDWLLAVHAPLLMGALFYLFAVVLGGLLVGFGVPERLSEIVSYAGFAIGFLLGCGAVVGKVAEIFDRAGSRRAIRP